jgi:hypothetical protein
LWSRLEVSALEIREKIVTEVAEEVVILEDPEGVTMSQAAGSPKAARASGGRRGQVIS